jgi:hypothetical protein
MSRGSIRIPQSCALSSRDGTQKQFAASVAALRRTAKVRPR